MMKCRNLFLVLVGSLLLPFAALAGPVNVNTADAETISAELQGVGLSRAKAIVAYRAAHGPFKSVDDLVLVKGIGERTVEINRDNILLDAAGRKQRK